MKPIPEKKHKDGDSSNTGTTSENPHRVLSPYDLVMFGIGNTIGAGIFALTGIAA